MVFVVDDDLSIRESLDCLIRHEGWLAETFASGREFLARGAVFRPHCVILDISLPDLKGLDLQNLIRDRVGMPIIFITGHGSVPMSVRAMKAGAAEFLTKPFEAAVMVGAIRHALDRSNDALNAQLQLHELRASYATLNPRERDVMKLVVAGYLNKQIAGRLSISEVTVKVHRGRTMRKMRANSLAELVIMADRLAAAFVTRAHDWHESEPGSAATQ